MENSEESNEQVPSPPNPNNASSNHQIQRDTDEEDDDDDFIEEEIEEEEEEEEEDDGDDDEDDVVSGEPNRRNPESPLSRLREQRFKLETLSRRLSSELLPIRVHDVRIHGNTKTKDWVIEAELKGIQDATTMQELIRASEIALARLQNLGIFDSSKLHLEAGPPELPNTANVIVDVIEADSKVSGEADSKVSGKFGVYTKPSVMSWHLRYDLQGPSSCYKGSSSGLKLS